MTLTLSNKFSCYSESFWDSNLPAFNRHKNKLTAVRKETTKTDVTTDPDRIQFFVNALDKPIYKKIDKFYFNFKNIVKINEILNHRNSGYSIDLEAFRAALQPTCEELEKNILAIHVSDYLWVDAIVRPFLGTAFGCSTPGIALTIHFSLGEMVRPHSKVHTWEERKFALITPLREIINKMVGLSPYDSFIQGDWEITPATLVIVPQDTEVPELYRSKNIRVIKYDPQTTSLRKFIKQQIFEQRGIRLKMVRNLTLSGAAAYLYGDKLLDINRFSFFKSLFDTYPKLSYGSDTVSHNGRSGYLFGVIRQLSHNLISGYITNPKARLNRDIYIYYRYFLKRIEPELSHAKKEEAYDLLRDYNACLSNEQTKGTYTLPSLDYLRLLTKEELEEFNSEHPEFFCNGIEYIKANWAVKRWLMLGAEQGTREGLEQIYSQNLTAFLSYPEFLDTSSLEMYKDDLSLLTNHPKCLFSCDMLNDIAVYLEKHSTRKYLALAILNLKITRAFNYAVVKQCALERELNIRLIYGKCHFFTLDYRADSIEHALIDYTGSQAPLENLQRICNRLDKDSFGFDVAEKEKTEFFLKLIPIKLETDLDELKESYSSLLHAIEFTPDADLEKELFETAMIKLRFLPKSVLLLWGKYHGANKLWARFNLENKFKAMFSDDWSFWHATETFMEIYQRLATKI